MGRGPVRHTPQGHMGVYLPTPSSMGSNDLIPGRAGVIPRELAVLRRRRAVAAAYFGRFLKNKRGFCQRGGIRDMFRRQDGAGRGKKGRWTRGRAFSISRIPDQALPRLWRAFLGRRGESGSGYVS